MNFLFFGDLISFYYLNNIKREDLNLISYYSFFYDKYLLSFQYIRDLRKISNYFFNKKLKIIDLGYINKNTNKLLNNIIILENYLNNKFIKMIYYIYKERKLNLKIYKIKKGDLIGFLNNEVINAIILKIRKEFIGYIKDFFNYKKKYYSLFDIIDFNKILSYLDNPEYLMLLPLELRNSPYYIKVDKVIRFFDGKTYYFIPYRLKVKTKF